MKARKNLLRGSVALVTLAMILVFVSGVLGVGQPPGASDKGLSVIIMIDTLKMYGKLDRAPVQFLHEKHTAALKEQKKDCKACHLVDKTAGALSQKFNRVKDLGLAKDRAAFHDRCLGCHNETADAGLNTGPVECGQCHNPKPSAVSAWKDIPFDRSLHYRHVRAQKDDCGKCHHEYNEKTKKISWVKGKESNCAYCHLAETKDKVISAKLAAHGSCVQCHLKTWDAKRDAGPVNCSGCHSAAGQAKIKKLQDVPRYKRNQPDVVLIKPVVKKAAPAGEEKTFTMAPVPFDHKAHENYNQSCMACHHKSLDSCAKKCHTLGGAKDGDFINLAQAMHSQKSEHSCLGCHQISQKAKNCAGCHASISKTAAKSKSLCAQCHVAPPADMAGMEGKVAAVRMLESRPGAVGTYSDADIPEVVVIKHLEKQYQPVKLPHRKIVKSLAEGIKDNKLAAFLHKDKGTLCQGCHHNSPPAKKPPRCANCHGQPFNKANVNMPGLKAAYHQQCMSCHKEMGLKKPVSVACAQCHEEKKK